MKLSYASPAELTSEVDDSLARISKGVEMILEEPNATFENTIEELSIILAKEQNIATFLQNVASNKEIRDASRDASEKITNFQTDLFSRKDLYDRIRSISVSDERSKRLQDIYLRDFEETGVSSPEAVALLKEINTLGIEFEKNISEDTTTIELSPEELAGMPDDYLQRTKNGEKHKITLSYPDILPIYENCSVKETRRRVKAIFESICPGNESLLYKMIQKRNQFAKCLNYESWTDYATRSMMAKTSPSVRLMLDPLLKTLKKPATTYVNKLQEIALLPLEREDVIYYGDRYLEKHYHIDPNVVRQYFPLSFVFPAMLEIYSFLLGLRFEKVTPPSDIWHSSVECYDVFDATTSDRMGTLYCDLFPREGKYSHAAVFILREGYHEGDHQVFPMVSLVCNFPTAPSLMPLGEVETLFHEFGHALHCICSGYRCKYAEFGFGRVVTDFVETPSQIVELWLRNPGILKRISHHYETGESLPDDLATKIVKSHSSGKEAYDWLRICAMAHFDHQVYTACLDLCNDKCETEFSLCSGSKQDSLSEKPNDFCLTTYFSTTMGSCCPLIPPHDTYINRWGHLGCNMYAGKYYSYVWSMVLATDLYSVFEKSGNILDPTIGRRYRKIILESGNAVDASDLVEKFLGRPYNGEAFLRMNCMCE